MSHGESNSVVLEEEHAEYTQGNDVFLHPMSAMGGGDGVTNVILRTRPPRSAMDTVRLRLLMILTNFAFLVVLPLIIVSAFVLMNIGVTHSRHPGYARLIDSKIFEIIKKGHIPLQYSRILNQALSLSEKENLRVLAKKLENLSRMYSFLQKNVLELMADMNGIDDDVEELL